MILENLDFLSVKIPRNLFENLATEKGRSFLWFYAVLYNRCSFKGSYKFNRKDFSNFFKVKPLQITRWLRYLEDLNLIELTYKNKHYIVKIPGVVGKYDDWELNPPHSKKTPSSIEPKEELITDEESDLMSLITLNYTDSKFLVKGEPYIYESIYFEKDEVVIPIRNLLDAEKKTHFKISRSDFNKRYYYSDIEPKLNKFVKLFLESEFGTNKKIRNLNELTNAYKKFDEKEDLKTS